MKKLLSRAHLGLKKNCLIGVTRPTLFLPPTLNIFIFLCAKKKILKTLQNKLVFSFSIAKMIPFTVYRLAGHSKWHKRCVTEKVKMHLLYHLFLYACRLCVLVCETYLYIYIKKKSDLPTLIFFLCYANQTIFFFRPYVCVS